MANESEPLPTAEDEESQPQQDPALPVFAGLAGQISVGGVLGYSVGYATREIGKKIMYYAGASVVALQGLSYAGYITIDWTRIFQTINKTVDANGDGKFDAEDVRVWWQRFRAMISNGIPGSAAFLGGVYMGLRS